MGTSTGLDSWVPSEPKLFKHFYPVLYEPYQGRMNAHHPVEQSRHSVVLEFSQRGPDKPRSVFGDSLVDTRPSPLLGL